VAAPESENTYKNTSKRATVEAPFACLVFVCFAEGTITKHLTRGLGRLAKEGTRPKKFCHYLNEKKIM